MAPDLERLLELQRLDTAAEDARKTIASCPQRIAALDAQLESARDALVDAKARKTQNESERRALEKDLATVRARRSKYQDQSMEVKTNREFHAIQHEMQAADEEIKRLEDQLLENMLAADEIAAAAKAADAAHTDAERSVTAQKQALTEERDRLDRSLADLARSRAALAATIAPDAYAVYDTVSRGRKQPAVAEARDGLCVVCHVRLRPQIYQEIRRNSHIVQCESCQRIMFYVPPPAKPATPPPV
jgi:hypothetical protein